MSKIQTIRRLNTYDVGGVGDDEIRWLFEEVTGGDSDERPWVVGDRECWCRLEDEDNAKRIDDWLRAEGASDGERIYIYTEK